MRKISKKFKLSLLCSAISIATTPRLANEFTGGNKTAADDKVLGDK